MAISVTTVNALLATDTMKLTDLKFTPGPWQIGEGPFDGEDDITIEKDGCPIATVRGSNDMSCIDEEEVAGINDEIMDTAILIHKAPDLLSAIVEARDMLDQAMILKKIWNPYMPSTVLAMQKNFQETIDKINKLLE